MSFNDSSTIRCSRICFPLIATILAAQCAAAQDCSAVNSKKNTKVNTSTLIRRIDFACFLLMEMSADWQEVLHEAVRKRTVL